MQYKRWRLGCAHEDRVDLCVGQPRVGVALEDAAALRLHAMIPAHARYATLTPGADTVNVAVPN